MIDVEARLPTKHPTLYVAMRVFWEGGGGERCTPTLGVSQGVVAAGSGEARVAILEGEGSRVRRAQQATVALLCRRPGAELDVQVQTIE
ncbi:MAG: hypothetical protein ABIX12_09385 [Rubrivivax sp.]